MKNFLTLLCVFAGYIFVPGLWHFVGLISARDVAIDVMGEQNFFLSLFVSFIGAVVFNVGIGYLLWEKRREILLNVMFGIFLLCFFVYHRCKNTELKLKKGRFFVMLILFSPCLAWAQEVKNKTGGTPSDVFYQTCVITFFGLFFLLGGMSFLRKLFGLTQKDSVKDAKDDDATTSF